MNKDEIETDLVKIDDFLKRAQEFTQQTHKVDHLNFYSSSDFDKDSIADRCISRQQRAFAHPQRCRLPD